MTGISSSLRTLCVHRPGALDGRDKSLSLPIDRSSTFFQDEEAQRLTASGRWSEALVYARYGNPTLEAVEAHLASLEGAERALLFSSGMAAIHALLLACHRPGQPLAVSTDLYGGTAELVTSLEALGLDVVRFDPQQDGDLEAALAQAPSLVWAETVSNPTLRVTDVPELAAQCHAAGAQLAVDATFSTPVLQRPLSQGADFVVHSATKALGGHSDLLAGVVLGSDEALNDVWSWRKKGGATLSADGAWLLERGLATLALRMEASGRSALEIAQALEGDSRVARVLHPHLASHPDHERASRILSGPVGLVSFELAGGDDALRPFVDRLQLVLDAPSLGGVETLVSLPRTMSHAALTDAERAAQGIGPGFVRLAVGIEAAEDLVADLLQALG